MKPCCCPQEHGHAFEIHQGESTCVACGWTEEELLEEGDVRSAGEEPRGPDGSRD